MPRPLRIEYAHAFYHVMNRGKGRQDIFHNSRYYQAFLDTVAEAQDRFNAVIHCYCLMSNHYHLIIETPLGNLGRIMRHINGVYTQRYNRMKKTDGPLFRGRYKAILVDADSYLLQLSRYIHRNPIESKRPLVNKLEKWPWSSYPAYIRKVKVPHWLTLEKVEGMMGFKKDQEIYSSFVEKKEEDQLDQFYKRNNTPAILGSQEFKETAIANAALSSRTVDRYIRMKPSAESIVAQIALLFKMKPEEITQKNTGRPRANFARKLAIYSCQRQGGMTLGSIANYFNLASNGSVSACIGYVKNKLMEKESKAVYDRLQENLNVTQYT